MRILIFESRSPLFHVLELCFYYIVGIFFIKITVRLVLILYVRSSRNYMILPVDSLLDEVREQIRFPIRLSPEFAHIGCVVLLGQHGIYALRLFLFVEFFTLYGFLD